MKKVTTKVTTKTPSTTSMTHTVVTTRLANARAAHQSGMQQPSSSRQGTGLQQPQRTMKTVSSKTSINSFTVGGQRKTRTEESVTTRIQMPIAQAASNWQTGLRGSSKAAPPKLTYGEMYRQQMQLQAEQAQAQAAQSGIPKMQIPRAVPREIASLAQQQYAQLSSPQPPPAPPQRQRQMPQFGGRQLQPPGQRRQMQLPQAGGAGSRSRMQPPGFQSRRPRGGVIHPAPPNMLAPPPPRQAHISPGTREFEMLEDFSPDTMAEYAMMEEPESPRHRTPQRSSPQRSPKGPCGPTTCGAGQQPQSRRTMAQPGFTSGMPRQVVSAAEQQYAALMDSPAQQRQSPQAPGSAGRRELEMLEDFSPDTLAEYRMMEQQESPRPCAPQPRRTMAQPGFTSGMPRQAVSAAEQQYAALMDTPQQRQKSPQASTSQQQADLANTSFPTAASGHPTDLEQQVEEALYNTSRSKPGTPLRAEGAIQRMITPEEAPITSASMVQTPCGPIPAETHLLIEAVVKRTPTEETVLRHVIGVDGEVVEERETLQMTPGKGIRRPKTPESVELIVCSSEVKMAGGYRETTSKVYYETTDEPPTASQSKLPSSVTPNIVSQLVLEESQDIDKTNKLHAPDLKHSSPLTYGIKKRVNTLQLNRMEVEELEQTVSWPPPRADQAQEDPQPELLATMMHTEEKGLAMGSTPDQLYSALFGSTEPVKADEGTVEVNSVAAHPLNDVVVPAAAATRDLHIAAMTPELADAAVSAQSGAAEEGRPSDGAYSERILGDKKDTASIKVKNVGHRDGPPVKYPVFFDAEKAAPWEVDKFDAVIKQVGAIPTSVLEASVVGPTSAEAADELRDFTTDGIEYLLNMDEVSHQTNVQLRGSQPPSWFPGYYMALSGTYGTGAVTLARSPSTVLAAAYKAVQPELYNDESIIVS